MIKNKDLQLYQEKASHVTIKDEATLLQATALLSEVNGILDEVTKEKKEKTSQLEQTLKDIKDPYTIAEKLLKEIIASVRLSLTVYATAQAIARQEEEERILEDGRTSDNTKINRLANVLPITKSAETEQGKVTFITITRYRLVNPAKVPVEYLEINTPYLKEQLKAGKPLPEGIEVYEEQSLRNYKK